MCGCMSEIRNDFWCLSRSSRGGSGSRSNSLSYRGRCWRGGRGGPASLAFASIVGVSSEVLYGVEGGVTLV